jgi:hypothetical protein
VGLLPERAELSMSAPEDAEFSSDAVSSERVGARLD